MPIRPGFWRAHISLRRSSSTACPPRRLREWQPKDSQPLHVSELRQLRKRRRLLPPTLPLSASQANKVSDRGPAARESWHRVQRFDDVTFAAWEFRRCPRIWRRSAEGESKREGFPSRSQSRLFGGLL